MRIRDWIESAKIKYHPVWIKRWNDDPFSVPPVYIEMSPAGACNHRCTFCAPEMLGYKTNYLKDSILAERFAEIKELREKDPDGLGIKSIQFAGEGEPMLHPKLGKIFGYARSAGIDVAMLSNGVALTEKRIHEILPFTNVYIQISINAGTAESYALIHKTGTHDWERLWKNLANLVRIKRESGSTCQIGANMTILVKEAVLEDGKRIPPNWPNVEDLAQKARDTGLDYVSFKPYSQHPYSTETMKLYGDMSYAGMMDEIMDTGDMLRDRYQTDDFEVIFRFSRFKEYEETDRGYARCLATPTLWSYVQADGVWISCSAHWTNADFHLGNINTQTINEIWFGERRRQHLEFMKDFDISVCRKTCHPDKENRYLLKFQQMSPEEQQAELVTLETLPFPHRGNVI
ncbi:MAG: radical SAM/SPASM domain-containing protein [bacterium]|nr:radical SAM/SPASM domain-containing protein [bacterium]